MKTLILAILLSISPMAFAESEKTPDEICESIASLAGTLFDARQDGVTLAESLRVVSDNEFFRRMTIDLYDLPIFRTASYIENSRNQYVTKWHLVCLRAFE